MSRTTLLFHTDCEEGLRELPENSVDAIVTDPPYGIGFMGKAWDATVPVTWTREAARVLKPGGHLVAFGGTRTFHRLAVALESSGFEIRDTLSWLYGQGFPKSRDLSKDLDRAAGKAEERGWIPVTGSLHEGTRNAHGVYHGRGQLSDNPVTEEAKRYFGYGTALKPAWEPVLLARKPLSEKTLVQNLLRWGTGGLNLHGCRLESEKLTGWGGAAAGGATWNEENCGLTKDGAPRPVWGRWPPNLLLDEETARELDLQIRDAEAGASRFFFVAKPDIAERNAGLQGMEQGQKSPEYREPTGNELVDRLHGVNRRGRENFHPTVKPVSLMLWLCRLVAPPEGLVLDPFMGSGTTGIAAKRLGLGFIGFEIEKPYFDIAKRRIEEDAPLFQRPEQLQEAQEAQLDLLASKEEGANGEHN